MGSLIIDLSDHKNPEDFLKKCQDKFPDDNVRLSLNGKKMAVDVADQVPTQIKISIFSFLEDQARHEIHLV